MKTKTGGSATATSSSVFIGTEASSNDTKEDSSRNKAIGSISCAFNDAFLNHAGLYADCSLAFTAKNLVPDENHESTDSTYSAGSTFLVKLDADVEQLCLLERAALEIARFHAEKSGLVYDPALSGAEWWTQVIDNRDDIGFHWDRDYGAEDKEDEGNPHIYPYRATVNYLSKEGGATIVIPIEGTSSRYEKFSNGIYDSSDMYFCTPAIGKQLYFDGSLLHGAPADYTNEDDEDDDEEDGDEEEQEEGEINRVTFLVNVWINHLPCDSKPLPEQYRDEMHSISKSTCESLTTLNEKGDEDEIKQWNVSASHQVVDRLWSFGDSDLHAYQIHYRFEPNFFKQCLHYDLKGNKLKDGPVSSGETYRYSTSANEHIAKLIDTDIL